MRLTPNRRRVFDGDEASFEDESGIFRRALHAAFTVVCLSEASRSLSPSSRFRREEDSLVSNAASILGSTLTFFEVRCELSSPVSCSSSCISIWLSSSVRSRASPQPSTGQLKYSSLRSSSSQAINPAILASSLTINGDSPFSGWNVSRCSFEKDLTRGSRWKQCSSRTYPDLIVTIGFMATEWAASRFFLVHSADLPLRLIGKTWQYTSEPSLGTEAGEVSVCASCRNHLRQIPWAC
jgi:hypothetical protein